MHDHRPAAPLLTSASITRRGTEFVVAVQGIQIEVANSKAQGITRLCKEAIARQETLVATIMEGVGKTYMTVTADGLVAASAAPATGTLKPDLTAPPVTDDMGSSANNEDSTRSWVEENLLTGTAPAPAKKSRFGFGRK